MANMNMIYASITWRETALWRNHLKCRVLFPLGLIAPHHLSGFQQGFVGGQAFIRGKTPSERPLAPPVERETA